jgi:hypothetical protein
MSGKQAKVVTPPCCSACCAASHVPRTPPATARREAAAAELGTPIGELDESDIVASADDEFLCSEALALWAMIRKARALARQT